MVCWADLWTSDVDGARSFYEALFGWGSSEPQPEFGGYLNFDLDGSWISGCMGDMGDMLATDSWKIYLASDDIERTARQAEAAGAVILSPPHPVGELGIQCVFSDPTGGGLGAWQAGTFPGFTPSMAHGAPCWFELHTDDLSTAVSFYASVFGWEAEAMADTDEFRYTTVTDPRTSAPGMGVYDASADLGDSGSSHWVLYFAVDSTDASTARAVELGGAVLDQPKETPYGRQATLADPTGATFRIVGPAS
jgi:predicted enzyme related to lactoylglutathione lyase